VESSSSFGRSIFEVVHNDTKDKWHDSVSSDAEIVLPKDSTPHFDIMRPLRALYKIDTSLVHTMILPKEPVLVYINSTAETLFRLEYS
jgi:hypothetical protein